MLNFASPIVNGELLYSYVSRWFGLSGYETVQGFNEAAFGRQIVHHVLNAHNFPPSQWAHGVMRGKAEVPETMTLVPFARVFIGEVAYDWLENAGGQDEDQIGAKVPRSLLPDPWVPPSERTADQAPLL